MPFDSIRIEWKCLAASSPIISSDCESVARPCRPVKYPRRLHALPPVMNGGSAAEH